MPLTRLAADAFGVVTICLVSFLVLLSLFCICYSLYFRSRTRRQGFLQLSYFNGPWIIRIVLVLIIIWWGLGEIIRLSLLKEGRGRALHALSQKWQEDLCKFYILSNLGFAEPSLFLTIILLLHASLRRRRNLGALNQYRTSKTFGYILLFCFPVFITQLVLVLIGPKLNNEKSHTAKLPKYFTRTSISSVTDGHSKIALCTYPLLSTILLGLFSTLLICYFLFLGKRMLSLVINKGLRRRVYLLIISVITFLPFRVIFLCLSVFSRPGYVAFEALVFLAFLMLLSCATVAIGILVYCPIADSLAVGSLRQLGDTGATPPLNDNDTSSLIANQGLLETASNTSVERNSYGLMTGGSISFRTMIKDDDAASAPDSPALPGQPVIIPLQDVSHY
ncbi:uncharacterized protein LOC143889405 [Tasmannia lanceolata]|uniref:uncharacterized protein LOC143889405 n=1 Tax=Tasmannia lanceolata TaxID=3420 RepID=UPI0040630A7B